MGYGLQRRSGLCFVAKALGKAFNKFYRAVNQAVPRRTSPCPRLAGDRRPACFAFMGKRGKCSYRKRDLVAREVLRPGDTLDIGPDTPLRLKKAAKIAYPDGSMGESGLRKEAERGRLVIERTANRLHDTSRH